MLSIHYEKLVPYPFDAILSQYYDSEHIEHVHPTTLGKVELLENGAERVVYKQTWPAGFLGQRAVSVVEQRFCPPNEICFRFLEGRYRGVRVHSLLHDRGAATLVDETYWLPWLPNWGWLRRLVQPRVMAMVNAIWEEDLQVGVCRDGWPGVPVAARTQPPAVPPPLAPPDPSRLCGRVVEVEGEEVLVVAAAGGACRAVSHRCPHTGGPLSLGTCDGKTVTCPWHGARFDLYTGQALCGPASRGLRVYAVQEDGSVR